MYCPSFEKLIEFLMYPLPRTTFQPTKTHHERPPTEVKPRNDLYSVSFMLAISYPSTLLAGGICPGSVRNGFAVDEALPAEEQLDCLSCSLSPGRMMAFDMRSPIPKTRSLQNISWNRFNEQRYRFQETGKK